jgi:superfamily II DNA or RNA helicase
LIIIGDSQSQCRTIQKVLKIKSINLAMAISDEQEAHNNITRFREDSSCNVLITYQMAYEGLDCKQATRPICLTRIRSIPWLIQAITRVIRYDDHKNALPWEMQRGYVYVPNDKEMLEALKRVGAIEGKEIVLNEEDNLNFSFLKEDKELEDKKIADNLITGMKSEIGDEFLSDNEGVNLTPDLLAKIRVVRSERYERARLLQHVEKDGQPRIDL